MFATERMQHEESLADGSHRRLDGGTRFIEICRFRRRYVGFFVIRQGRILLNQRRNVSMKLQVNASFGG